ncbi:AIPR family protein [Aeromonas veronii]|uniref:AIPR family protein n=1 Tax=Aeromonas veronii TaxID=654 RepID=UPI00111A7BB6|nr:AIPR family protein [Aeromonas veronii]TNI83286.1 hypothetical protein CF116_00585 [Aeromonas veronii]
MQHLNEFRKQSALIQKYGEGNAHLIWSFGLYIDESDLEKLAIDGLTDGGGDRKIDLIYQSNNTLYIVQGYYSSSPSLKIAASANKASDLNTALAWLTVGDLTSVPTKLRDKITESRLLIEGGEIDSIELLYIHNCAESENVRAELETCANYLNQVYSGKEINVGYKELGQKNLEKLYIALSQQIIIKDKVSYKGEIFDKLSGSDWASYIGYANGEWLSSLFNDYGSDLFSANYRGFMGLSKRKKINTAIKQTAEHTPDDFFVYNNGISILTTEFDEKTQSLDGISIINGAQTTGSIGSVSTKGLLNDLKVMCKIIVCKDPEKVKRIVQFNNTQNHITTWDHYANSPDQTMLVEEFKQFGFIYSLKRGFDNSGSLFGIESVAQPLVALHGDYSNANRGKNYVFETKSIYDNAFHESKAQHVLLAYCIAKSIEKVKGQLKQKDLSSQTSQEKRNLMFLENLKSKYFMMSVIGKVLEDIVSKPINPKLAKFSYSSVKNHATNIDYLIDLWCPVISSLLPIVLQVVGDDIYGHITKEDALEQTSTSVKSSLLSLKALTKMQALEDLSAHIE